MSIQAPPVVANPATLPLALQTDYMSVENIKARYVARYQAARPLASARTGGLLDTEAGIFSTELSQFLPALGRKFNDSFAQTAEDDEMVILRAAEQSLFQTPAVAAIVPVTFGNVPGYTYDVGTLVATGPLPSTGIPLVYSTLTPAVVNGSGFITVNAQCTTTGAIGNIAPGAIQFMVTAGTGTESIANGAPTTLGEDIQSPANLLLVYLNFWRNQPTSGNPAQYFGWAFDGSPAVGGVVITRTPTGAGSVGISLIGLTGQPATPDVVAAVQAYITPTLIPNQGVGAIGPRELLIYAAPADPIATSVNLVFDPSVGLTDDQIVQNIIGTVGGTSGIIAYLAGIAFAGSNQPPTAGASLNSVQPDQIAAIIGATPGVLSYDIGSLRINGQTQTIAVPRDHVAVYGGLSVNGASVPVIAHDGGTMGESISVSHS